MQIKNESSYFKITPNGLEATTNRKERSSLNLILDFFNDEKRLKSDRTRKQFVNKWPVIKANFEEKKLESRYGLIGVIIRIFYNLFSENQKNIVSRLDGKIQNHKFLLGLEEWLVDPNAKGMKKEATDRIKKCKDNLDLKELDLSRLGLTTLPDFITEIYHLETLILTHNPIQALPDSIGNLINLEILFLSGNQIQALPESIGNLQKLEMFFLDSNSDLVDLPLNLGSIPALTLITTQNTNIPLHVVEAILNACEMLKKNESINSLPILLTKWLKIAYNEQETANQLVEDLNNQLTLEEKSHLYEWLIRLERTKDFKNNQSRLAKTTGEMLKALLHSQEFREVFFPQVELNNTACEDRSAMAYNEIYLSFCLCVKANELSHKEELLLMLKGSRTQALMKDLSGLIGIHESKTGVIEQESVEIYLYYLTSLSGKLDLLLAIQDMRYKAIGKRDWIDQEALIVRVKQNTIDELVSLPAFENSLKKYDEFKDELGKLIEESCEELEKLNKDSLGWLKDTISLKKKFEVQKQNLLKKWALELIRRYQLDF